MKSTGILHLSGYAQIEPFAEKEPPYAMYSFSLF